MCSRAGGDGRFDPDAPVTLAELSAIWCRLKGKEVTELGGHWAGSALKETELGMEWTFSLTPGSENRLLVWWGENDYSQFPYADSPAYRADAFRLLAGWAYSWRYWRLDETYDLSYWLSDYVPNFSDIDINKISDRDDYYDACMFEDIHGVPYYLEKGHYFYPQNIDDAYQIGLTSGVDANHTCNALGTLTRAQLAQMCYNMGWISVGSFAAFRDSLPTKHVFFN